VLPDVLASLAAIPGVLAAHYLPAR